MGVLTRGTGLPLWSDYIAFARRNRGVIAAMMAVGLQVGFVWAFLQPSAYSATASVALVPVPVYVVTTTDELVPPEVSIDTDAQLLQSDEVLGAIATALDIDQEEAIEHLSVSASANTHVLHVTVSADSPEHAAEASNAAVNALIDVRRDALGALQDDQLRQLRMLVGNHGGALEQALEQDGEDSLLPADDADLDEVVGARESLDELEEASANPAEVVQPALPPRHADYANTEVALVSGAMAGLLAGCLIGAGRDRLRRTGASPGAPPGGRTATTNQSIGTIDQKDHHAV